MANSAKFLKLTDNAWANMNAIKSLKVRELERSFTDPDDQGSTWTALDIEWSDGYHSYVNYECLVKPLDFYLGALKKSQPQSGDHFIVRRNTMRSWDKDLDHYKYQVDGESGFDTSLSQLQDMGIVLED